MTNVELRNFLDFKNKIERAERIPSFAIRQLSLVVVIIVRGYYWGLDSSPEYRRGMQKIPWDTTRRNSHGQSTAFVLLEEQRKMFD